MKSPAGSHPLRSDALLLLTAAIWGFAFVAQRASMEHIGPFTFNALRFGIGSLVLLPFVLRRRTETASAGAPSSDGSQGVLDRKLLTSALIAGMVLFAGASLQQTGLVYTTAGKAGFITGLYVILVPLFGLLWRHRPGLGGWLGAVLAIAGLFLLSVDERLAIARGDALVLAGAFAWAAHVLLIARLSRDHPPLTLAAAQFLVCALVSTAIAVAFEHTTWAGIVSALAPILYSGLLSGGIAFTLQVVAQRTAPPAHAAIIMSLEAVFAAFGGWLVLHESLSARDLAGCALMLAGMLVSQFAKRAYPESAPQ
jgi:drug/metabolite transporter (DMT)-like permease